MIQIQLKNYTVSACSDTAGAKINDEKQCNDATIKQTFDDKRIDHYAVNVVADENNSANAIDSFD